jgi:hypothetical protein
LNGNFNKNHRLPLQRGYGKRILKNREYKEEIIYFICQNILGRGKRKGRIE